MKLKPLTKKDELFDVNFEKEQYFKDDVLAAVEWLKEEINKDEQLRLRPVVYAHITKLINEAFDIK